MAITLDTVRTNKAIRTIAAYVQQYTDEHYQEQWQQEYEELLAAWKKSGERSYTLHLHKFFTPLQKELEQIGLKFAQGLHGDLFQSIEIWGALLLDCGQRRARKSPGHTHSALLPLSPGIEHATSTILHCVRND